MRYIVAFIGALFIFVGTFILSAFLVPRFPAFLRRPVNLGLLHTNNIVGVLLASSAATASFRATLRHYASNPYGVATRALPPIQVGGLYATPDADGGWRVMKVLALDEHTVHLRIYANRFPEQPSDVDPAALTIGGLNDPAGVGIGHVPLAKEGFFKGKPILIKVVPVKEDELEGYKIYLEAMSGGGTSASR
jgi:hypothetical protein